MVQCAKNNFLNNKKLTKIMRPIYKNWRVILSGCIIINNKNEILLLLRKKHNHYETPGGKINLEECKIPGVITNEDLAKAAERELYEELGDGIKVEKLNYFGET